MEPLLLSWFERSGRALPWRSTRDPYSILVSEVMLQQTQVERVVPRYLAWLERWPTVESLAAASPADAIREWQGLGYNRRALNLHRAVRRIAEGGWPDDLTTLPGVGPYTAAAVRCFAFGEDVLPVDVNVERVVRRTGGDLCGVVRPGAHGPRCDHLPGSCPPLRRVPARGASAPRAASRRIRRASRGRSKGRFASGARRRFVSSRTPRVPSTRSTTKLSARSSATASSWSTRAASSPCRPSPATAGAGPRRWARRARRCRPARRAGPGHRGRRTRRPRESASPSTPPRSPRAR